MTTIKHTRGGGYCPACHGQAVADKHADQIANLSDAALAVALRAMSEVIESGEPS